MTDTTTVTAHAVTAHAATPGVPPGTGAPAAPPDRRRRPLPDRLREAGGRVASAVLAAHDAGVPF